MTLPGRSKNDGFKLVYRWEERFRNRHRNVLKGDAEVSQLSNAPIFMANGHLQQKLYG